MLKVNSDPVVDSVYIQFNEDPIGNIEELDGNRLIDHSLYDNKPAGIDLQAVSHGVKLDGLPEREEVERILVGLGITVKGE